MGLCSLGGKAQTYEQQIDNFSKYMHFILKNKQTNNNYKKTGVNPKVWRASIVDQSIKNLWKFVPQS